MRDTLFVIDISGFIHRAFHVHKDLVTSKGFPSGAVYGTINILSKFILEHNPKYMMICYDAQDGKSIRKDMYPEYKANRVHVNAVSAQEQVVRKIIEYMGICSVVRSGYEADDLIASVTHKFKNDLDVIIVTGDKDMLQLIDGNRVTIYDSMKDITYGEEEAINKFGVRSSQISDYLALVGDKVDNIPGARGIGPKAAQELLSRYASVEDMLEPGNFNMLSDKYREKLLKSMDDLRVSKQLANLMQVDIDSSIEDMRINPTYPDELDDLLSKLEFSDTTKNKLRKVARRYE